MLTAPFHATVAAWCTALSTNPFFAYGVLGLLTLLFLYTMYSDYRTARLTSILRAVIDAYNAPVLFYDDKGRLVYRNTQAADTFAAVGDDITRFAYIEKSSTREGPHFLMTDVRGNGYRLEIMRKAFDKNKEGRVVIVKGYAQNR